jgi:hypothetical protein
MYISRYIYRCMCIYLHYTYICINMCISYQDNEALQQQQQQAVLGQASQGYSHATAAAPVQSTQWQSSSNGYAGIEFIQICRKSKNL